MSTQKETWLTALEHVLESYPNDYQDFLRDNGLEEDEISAQKFLEYYEGNLD